MVKHNSIENHIWFAMSAPYRKELQAKSFLDDMSIENFIPMHYKIIEKKSGEKSRRLIPIIRNLIFVRTTSIMIREIKKQITFLQYLTNSKEGRNIPIVIPNSQMEQFIGVCRTFHERLIYLKPEEINLKKGTPVRVIGGSFNGVEGIFIKIKGSRSRRVVVLLQSIAAVATAEIDPDFLEIMS